MRQGGKARGRGRGRGRARGGGRGGGRGRSAESAANAKENEAEEGESGGGEPEDTVSEEDDIGSDGRVPAPVPDSPASGQAGPPDSTAFGQDGEGRLPPPSPPALARTARRAQVGPGQPKIVGCAALCKEHFDADGEDPHCKKQVTIRKSGLSRLCMKPGLICRPR